jgi:hypothetical protein
MHKQTGYAFFRNLDISMQYYTALDEESKDLTTIIMPFGKHCYSVLPMGLKCSPNFAQETMESIFPDIDDAKVYVDDISTFSPNWEHHLKLLCTIPLNYRRTVLQYNRLHAIGQSKKLTCLDTG